MIRSMLETPRRPGRLSSRVGALATLLSTVAGLVAVASAAAPPPKQFLANLNGGQETPPVTTPALGVAHLTFDNATGLLCYSISYTGLGSAEILAHIHGPALPGVPAGVLFPLPLGTSKSGCTPALTRSQKASLLRNLLYINVHSVGFPAGEIRGQILRIK